MGSAQATSVAIPAHQADDVICLFVRAASNTPAPKPTASGTVPDWTLAQSAGANTLALVSAWTRATAATTTSGTWTGASHLCVIVFRPDAGKRLSVGASAVGNANNTQTVVYPALTLTVLDGTSWGVRCGTRSVAVASLGAAPTNWIHRISQPAATPIIVVSTRGGLTAHPTADSVATAGTNAASRAHTLEVLEQVKQQPMVTIA